MNRDVVIVLISALVATLNPSLLAAVTVMLLLPHPRRLMSGYLLGAYTSSAIAGLLIVFLLHGTGAARTSTHLLSPAGDIAVGAIALSVALALATGGDARLRSWRQRRNTSHLGAGETDPSARTDGSVRAAVSMQTVGSVQTHGYVKADACMHTEASLQMRMLARGSVVIAFTVGAAMSFPGVGYVNALDHIAALDPPTVSIVLLVAYFCVMQQILLEGALLAYTLAADRTEEMIGQLKAWLARHGHQLATVGLSGLGILLVARGALAIGKGAL